MDSVFRELYEKYHQELYQFLFYMVKNRETAEDIAQEVYIRVMKSYSGFEGKSSERTWLYSIARNAAIDHFRKQTSWRKRIFENYDWEKQPVKDPQVLPEEIAVQNDQIQWIYKSMEQCTLDQRTVIILRYIQGLSIVETAAVLGWTDSKVKTTQHRALKAIKRIMVENARKEGDDDEKIRLGRS